MAWPKFGSRSFQCGCWFNLTAFRWEFGNKIMHLGAMSQKYAQGVDPEDQVEPTEGAEW